MNHAVKFIRMALWTLFLCVNFVACGSDSEDKPYAPSKSTIENFIPANMTFTENAGEQTFSFTANTAWTVSVAATSGGTAWCTASPTQGRAGSQTVKITTMENDTYDDRSVTIILKASSESKSFVVTQKQKNAILLTSDKFEIEQNGGILTVEVKANVNFTATIGETCKDWITEVSDTRALSATTKRYAVATNEESEKREGTITFSDGTLFETVHIYQGGGDILLLSKNEYQVDAAGEEITVELSTNCEYEVEMPQVDWIHATSTRAMSSHTLHYTVDANTAYDSREAKIIYRNKQKNIVDTLTVIQAQKDAIVLSKKEVTVKAEGETIEVKLSTNVDYEVIMPEVDWICVATTRGLTEHTLYYHVEKNEDYESRSAKISFINKASGVEDVLLVNQKGVMPDILTIYVPNAGDLPRITEHRDFEALKLVGCLNGTDIKAIREMKDCKYLDISETSIVAGGDYYYSTKYTSYYTIDNEIGDYMFHEMTALEVLFMPNSVRVIGNHAFEHCSNLASVNIPNSVTTIGYFAFCMCKGLPAIHIPHSVITIGEGAFNGCSSLISVDIPNGVTTIDLSTFNYCSSLTNINIPNSVTTIRDGAFAYCNSLINIHIPDSVTTIGNYVFSHCTSLTSIHIPQSVTTIGSTAFLECCSLISVDIPHSVTTIGIRTFFGCSSLTNINIPNSITTIEREAFEGCSSLTSINIPNSVTKIERAAFRSCDNITSVRIGTGVTDISDTDLLQNVSITEIYCFATTPPKSTPIDFYYGYKAKAKLYIPKGTYQVYYLSNWGNCINNIIEMEE